MIHGLLQPSLYLHLTECPYVNCLITEPIGLRNTEVADLDGGRTRSSVSVKSRLSTCDETNGSPVSRTVKQRCPTGTDRQLFQFLFKYAGNEYIQSQLSFMVFLG